VSTSRAIGLEEEHGWVVRMDREADTGRTWKNSTFSKIGRTKDRGRTQSAPFLYWTDGSVPCVRQAASAFDADPEGAGVAAVRTPVCHQRPDRLTLMRIEAFLKSRNYASGPASAEEVILSYQRVQGGLEGTSVGKEARKKRAMFSIRLAKYRPHHR
jgi:hypothetical protein